MSNTQIYRGVIVGYRRGTNNQYPRQVYVVVDINKKSVYALIGCKVVAKDSKENTYIGKIVKIVGSRNPKAIVVFRRNIPGSLIGKPVIIKAPKIVSSSK